MLWIWLVLVATAHAEPRTDGGLLWHAPAACPDADDARARIARRIGSPSGRATDGIEVEIAPDGDGAGPGFVARVELPGIAAHEARILTSAGCDELTDAVAVVIARLAVANAEPAAELEHRPAVADEEPHLWGGGLWALGVSGIGALPGVDVGIELGVYVRRGSLFVELAADGWLPRSEILHPRAPGRVDIRLRTAELRIGWRPELIPLRAWIAGELGSIEGEGSALGEPHAGAATWASAGIGFAVARQVMPHVRLVGALEVTLPFQRVRFVLQDGLELYRSEPATARCGLGLEVGWR